MRSKLTFLVATVLVAVVVAQLDAQEEQKQKRREGQGQRGQGQRGQGQGRGPGFGGPGRGGGGIVGLLRMEEVRKEIELLDEQLADVEKMQEELRGQRPQGDGQRPQGGERRNFQDLSEEERAKLREEFQARQREQQERQREQNKKAEELLSEILLPHQMDRLKELAIQRAGTGALVSEEVAGKLGLSEDKRKEIAGVLGSMRERMGALFQRGEGGERPNREEMMAKFAELRKAIEKDALGKLTESQREEFAKLKGEPFDFPAFAGFGGGRDRRRGGDDGGGERRRPQRPAADE